MSNTVQRASMLATRGRVLIGTLPHHFNRRAAHPLADFLWVPRLVNLSGAQSRQVPNTAWRVTSLKLGQVLTAAAHEGLYQMIRSHASPACQVAIIAHIDLPPPRVSKYGVDVVTLNRFAATLRDAHDRSAIYLVDEIGKMECLSAAFVDAIRGLLEDGRHLVATIAQRGGGFIDEVKCRHDVEVWTVTQATRDALPDQIAGWIQAAVRRD